MKTVFKILGIAAIHYFLQTKIMLFGLSMAFGRFDTMEPSAYLENVSIFMGKLVMLPLALPMIELYPNGPTSFLLSYLPFVLNSLFWAASILYVWRKGMAYMQTKKHNLAEA